MISFARFMGSPPVQTFVHGMFSAKIRRQSFRACLTNKDTHTAMSKKIQAAAQVPQSQAFIEANAVIKFILGVLVTIFAGFGSFWVWSFSPLQVKVAAIDERVAGIDKNVTNLREDLKRSQAATQQTQEELKAFINQDTLPLLLRRSTEGKSEELLASLPRARRYLEIAKQKGVPSDPTIIRGKGKSLLKDYKTTHDTTLKQETFQTAVKAADYLTVLRPVPPKVIEEAKAKGIFFEGGNHTLSVNTPAGAVYKDATVTIEGNQLDLSKIYFINTEFKLTQSDIGEQFLSALFTSSGSAISFEFPPRKPLAQSKEDHGES